ncbi:hypothetical protein GCM10009799_21960 [Nocardiopsis rhodophaea]|uniref:Uncharacterized protein n=1 Tax=Nocardiopsis rhodophaea TaxID=280238 RepID=A0ABN2SZA1_9ACTN
MARSRRPYDAGSRPYVFDALRAVPDADPVRDPTEAVLAVTDLYTFHLDELQRGLSAVGGPRATPRVAGLVGRPHGGRTGTRASTASSVLDGCS